MAPLDVACSHPSTHGLRRRALRMEQVMQQQKRSGLAPRQCTEYALGSPSLFRQLHVMKLIHLLTCQFYQLMRLPEQSRIWLLQ